MGCVNEEAQYAQFIRIEQLYEWERLQEAIKETENYIQQYPEDADGYAVLSKVYLKQGDHKKALHWSLESLKKDPENEIAWEFRVSTLYTAGKYKETMTAIQEALTLFPDDAFYYFLKGNIYNKNGKYEEAKESFLIALKLEPSNALYLASYSYVESILGNQEIALQAEKQALQLDSESSMVFLYVAWAADQRGDYAQALSYLENAVRLEPNNQQLRVEYLEILQKQFKVYQWLLVPSRMLNKVKPAMVFLIWFVAWMLFKPLVVVFIILYVAAHWITKMIVNVKVFGRLFVKV